MARYSGGAVTLRALNGPRLVPDVDNARNKCEVAYTLQCIQDIRQELNHNEHYTIKKARELGLSWREIATTLGVSRQAAWERWHEIDQDIPQRAITV